MRYDASNKRSSVSAFPTIENLEARRLLTGQVGYVSTFGHDESFDTADVIKVDGAGNTFVAGTLQQTLDLDPFPNSTQIISASNNKNNITAYFAKYSATGRLVWAHTLNSPDKTSISAIQIGSNGDLFIAGSFKKTLTYTVGRTVKTLVGFGDRDGFVARLDGGGNFRWAGAIGGPNYDYVNALAVDSANNVFITGTVRLTGDLNPGPGVLNVRTRGVDDAFVSRLNGSNGNLVWTVAYGENNSDESAFSLIPDDAGGVYAAGHFSRTVQFDRNNADFTRKSNGNEDIYIGHLNARGKWTFVNTIGGKENEFMVGLAQGPGGDLFLAGSFHATVDFNPLGDPFTMNPIGKTDAFVARYHTDGTLVWAKQIGGKGTSVRPLAMSIDSAGNVWTTGQFQDTVDFDPGPGTFFIKSVVEGKASGFREIQPHVLFPLPVLTVAAGYVSKLGADGRFLFAGQIGGSKGSVRPRAIGTDAAGNAYLGGIFLGTANFAPTGRAVIRSSVKDKKETDIFFMKLLA